MELRLFALSRRNAMNISVCKWYVVYVEIIMILTRKIAE